MRAFLAWLKGVEAADWFAFGGLSGIGAGVWLEYGAGWSLIVNGALCFALGVWASLPPRMK